MLARTMFWFLLVSAGTTLFCYPSILSGQTPVPDCSERTKDDLPLPSTFLPGRLPEFQKILTGFLQRGDYLKLKWCGDKGLRYTGPFINKASYGVHPTVKIYYSPEIMRWLIDGRDGTVPDGAMIIKEQYAPPAAQYQIKPPLPVSDWTIMIKDSKGSKDGWYWAEIWEGQNIDNNDPPYNIPNAGFGLYCSRCHASAEKDHTFVSLSNIKGFPGQPLSYFVDFSWVPQPSPTPATRPLAKLTVSHHDEMSLLSSAKEPAAPPAPSTLNPA